MGDNNKPIPDLSGTIEHEGVSIYYEYFGKRDRPAVVLFNGVAMETRAWYQFLPFITSRADVLLWDFRGQGASNSADEPYDICEHAVYLGKILDAVGLPPERTNPIGISTGSIYEAEFLRQFSHRVHRAVLSGVVLSPERPFAYASDIGIQLLRNPATYSVWVDSLYCNLYSDGFLAKFEPYLPKLRQAVHDRWQSHALGLSRIIEAQKNYVANIDRYLPDFKKVNTPCMLLVGEHDVMTPPFVQKKLIERFGGPVEYREFPGSGHMLLMENTVEFFGQALDFVLA